MSHAPIKTIWWSELESNQPFGLFRPALIHLSYPAGTEGEIRTLESSLEDSHVSSYITSAKWNSRQDSNPQPRRSKRRALPIEPQEQISKWSGRTESNCHHECPRLGCLRYTTPRYRKYMAELNGLEPSSAWLTTKCLTSRPQFRRLGELKGVEPSRAAVTVRCSTIELQPT